MKLLWGLLTTLVLANTQCAFATDIVVWKRNFDAPYMHAALSNILALSEDKYGRASLTSSAEIEQGRAFANMATNKGIDIFVGGIDAEREATASPIYFPIDRGLLGFRLCLMHEQKKSFNDIKTLEELRARKVLFGMGTHWPDKNTFESQGFETVTSPRYESLFSMLINDRFDCFLRSLAEIGAELEQRPKMPLKIEENLVFIYPSAEFLFVSNMNPELKERLNYGFERAIENGSFFDIFKAHYQQTMQSHNVYSRKLLIMENNDVSARALKSINQYGLASFVVP
jgi:ABC-type amino acid transport substrate-binding protein